MRWHEFKYVMLNFMFKLSQNTPGTEYKAGITLGWSAETTTIPTQGITSPHLEDKKSLEKSRFDSYICCKLSLRVLFTSPSVFSHTYFLINIVLIKQTSKYK